MGVVQTTPQKEITEKIDAFFEYVENETIRLLSDLGELCVNRVRDRSGEESWFDQSGNLRSSIGYVIVQNGKIIQLAGFKQVKQGTEGVKEGKALALELAKRFTKGYALVVVAGMAYAEYVEVRDSKDVLASTKLWVRSMADRMFEQLKERILRGISSL